jgi:Fe-S oxidoreductase
MTRTLTYSTTLDYMECCYCGVPFGLSSSLNAQLLANHSRSFCCPNGHSQHYLGETEAQQEKRLRKRAEDQAAAALARADQAEASLRTTKGHVTRLRRQVLAGECPFCGQHLRDLARHVGRVHPNEDPEHVEVSHD